MLTKMTEEDWVLVLEVFHACRSRRGDKGRDDRKFFEALHYFTVHNITWRALPAEFGSWNSIWKRFWRLSRSGVFETFFEALASLSERAHLVQMFDSNRHPRACVGGRRKRGQDGEALGRSRGGFSTKIHLKTDLDGYPIGFHLTGGEASDSRNFEVLLDLGPDVDPRAVVADKGYDAKTNREAARKRGICPVIPYRSNTIDKPKFFAKGLYKARARIEQMMGKIKRFKTYRATLREDGNKLCLIPRTRLRIHLDQIRPHGLASNACGAPFSAFRCKPARLPGAVSINSAQLTWRREAPTSNLLLQHAIVSANG